MNVNLNLKEIWLFKYQILEAFISNVKLNWTYYNVTYILLEYIDIQCACC